MEEKNDRGLKHLAHKHLLVLNENYIGGGGYYCWGCQEQIDSCQSSVYSCSDIRSYDCARFLLHKACAELPPKILCPIDQNEFLFFQPPLMSRNTCCRICGFLRSWMCFTYCSSFNTDICVCLKCAIFQVQQSKEDPIFVHPGHSHPLALIQHPSSFQCYACKVNDNKLDSSYRCTKCQFWIHKSCGDAPHSSQFQFHKHPLKLSFSLPEVYRTFDQFCRICNERVYWIEWLYCCRSCRYFTHFHCARSRSSPILSSNEDETYPNLVHLPAADELSLNLLLEQFIKDKITLSDTSYKSNSISSSTKDIKHWSHEEHVLKLTTFNELFDRENDDEMLLLRCNGCDKPIRTYDSLFYGCVPCKYFMHKVCAELPREIEHHLWPGKTLIANKKYTFCDGCYGYGKAIFFSARRPDGKGIIDLHIGCVTLPKIIKHEAHHHQLHQVFDKDHACNACGWRGRLWGLYKHECKQCNFYICGGCIVKARTYKHRWDPHPLDLIYDAGMVEEHEHEFECENCSKEIDTNNWFYHCSKCDLSFHINDCLIRVK
ncbi:Phorbol-ester/DAG-type domain-containing protein [Heracleum sosnowskyi]|uniref:Phorbol-ester/DAG-type domain-containing protein n=1 Tax=Heracleum sosnowskyi TaxID=360622 RepID=A0AAD8H1P4_9APIA|nr:Phorbol-ester/DAG-type domain-containing protein [Heracleum sosnowskyi]